ncbi:hypothetical protein X975_06670, partial [Stegodyphus mimosarum]
IRGYSHFIEFSFASLQTKCIYLNLEFFLHITEVSYDWTALISYLNNSFHMLENFFMSTMISAM